MKINPSYFSMEGLPRKVKYFLNQGSVPKHLLDRFKWYAFPKLHIVSSFPTHVDIEVSSRCQLNCPMCQRNSMKAGEGLMEYDLYCRIVDQVKELGVYSIKLSWRGEPLLHPQLFDMIRYAKERGINDVSFLTNLGPLTNNRIMPLIKSGVDWISVSADGLFETYEKIRYPLKFDETFKKIQQIRNIREEMGKQKPLIRIQSIYSAIKKNPKKYWDFWSKVTDKINFIPDQMRSNKEANFPRDPKFQCQSPWLRFFIGWNGNVANCATDYSETNIMGNVPKTPLKEIWHSNKFNQLRKLHRHKKYMIHDPCRTCAQTGLKKPEIVDLGDRQIRINTFVGQNVFEQDQGNL